MTDTKKLYWLRDAKFKDRYVVAGKPWPLVPTLSFLEGMRERAEQVGFMLQRLWPRKRACLAQDILSAWDILNQHIQIEDAFLLDTRWYKQTIFIGPVTDRNQKNHFVKYFKNRDDAGLALHQSEFMDAHFGGHFKTVPAKIYADRVAVYPLIDHSDDAIPSVELTSVTYEISAHLYKVHQDNTKPLASFVTLDMPIMFKKHEHSLTWRLVRDFIETHDGTDVSLIPIHGDMVPWNVFYNPKGEMTLVDYERCGWHVPFYDFFHLIVQPGCMKGKEIDVTAILTEIAGQRQTVLTWFILYLLDQLRFDMDSYYNQGQAYPRLKKAIDIKLNLLELSLKEINT